MNRGVSLKVLSLLLDRLGYASGPRALQLWYG